MLLLKRAYEPATPSDGRRILVDRLWPRGLSRERAALDDWMKEIAPSTELRQWFGHEPERWPEFRRRYRKELEAHGELVHEIAKLASQGRVTLLFAARDETRNEAVVLAEAIGAQMRGAATPTRGRTPHPQTDRP